MKKFSDAQRNLFQVYANTATQKRLQILKLPTLEYRRKRGRIIEVFKILNGLYNTAATEMFITNNERDTRRNPSKIVTKKTKTTARQIFFTVAAINDWNSLPETVISSDSVHVFKQD